MSKRDYSTVAIDTVSIAQSGVASRVYVALDRAGRRGLTLQEIAQICDLKPSSVKWHALPKLFHAQVISEYEEEGEKRYYFPRADLAVKGLEASKRSRGDFE